MSLAICAIVKDCPEAYLNFWVEYHLDKGVDHIYIYDNESATPITFHVLDPVTVIPFGGRGKQPWAYKHAFANFGHLHEWMAVIDDDELIYTRDNQSIPSILEDFPDVGGLCLNWIMFGSSGIKKSLPDGNMLEGFTKCAPPDYCIHSLVKTIARPSCVIDVGHPHYCLYREGIGAVDEIHRPVPRANSLDPVYDRIWVNHYFNRSEEDFLNKIRRGRASTEDASVTYSTDSYNQTDIVCTSTFSSAWPKLT
jgi:hypothetical protein